MSVDPMTDDEDKRKHNADFNRATALILAHESRPAVTYDRARELLPFVDDFARRIVDLRGWLTFLIEQDCETNARTEVRIGDALYVYRGEKVYALDDAAALHFALIGAVTAGELTLVELDAAIVRIDVPARVEYRVHNGRLNDLVKRGGAVADAIRAHRTDGTAPAKLKPKGK